MNRQVATSMGQCCNRDVADTLSTETWRSRGLTRFGTLEFLCTVMRGQATDRREQVAEPMNAAALPNGHAVRTEASYGRRDQLGAQQQLSALQTCTRRTTHMTALDYAVRRRSDGRRTRERSLAVRVQRVCYFAIQLVVAPVPAGCSGSCLAAR